MSHNNENIESALRKIVSEEHVVKWSDFVLEMQNTIIADKKPSTTSNHLKRTWKSHFTTSARRLNLKINSSNDNWIVIENKISQNVDVLAANSDNSTVEYSDITSSKSSSSSELKIPITMSEKKEILNIYNNLQEDKLWKLSTGKIVEKQMEELVKKSHYEHPAFSFIFDAEDDNWTDYFTEQELEEIRTHKSKGLPTLPNKLTDYINNIKQEEIDMMHKFISDPYYHPVEDYICRWAQKSVIEGIELFMMNFLKNDNLNERDLISRIWKLIPLAFDQGKMIIKEEGYSQAVNSQINKKRRLSSGEIIERKASTKRTDQLIKFNQYELGIVESFKVDDDYGTKFFLESMKRVPKILKDILLQLIKAVPKKRQELRVASLITSKLDMDMITMDNPEQYVFRVQRTEKINYPYVFDAFSNGIKSCLMMTWLFRMICEESIEHLTTVDHTPIQFKTKKRNDILPTFYKKKTK